MLSINLGRQFFREIYSRFFGSISTISGVNCLLDSRLDKAVIKKESGVGFLCEVLSAPKRPSLRSFARCIKPSVNIRSAFVHKLASMRFKESVSNLIFKDFKS